MTISLPLARNRLTDAISALCDPTTHNGHPLDSRYTQLRDAITNPSAADARRHIAQIMLTIENQQSALNWLLMAQIATTIAVLALLITAIIR